MIDEETPDLFAAEPSSPPAPPSPPAPSLFDDGSALPLDSDAERAYLSYAMSVVRSRALPQV